MTIEFAAKLQLGSFSYEAAFEGGDELIVLFGHSGAGKSITLAMVAGLLTPREGRISIDGHMVLDTQQAINLSPQGRNVGYVVQDLALFPHMTVASNIAFGMPAGTNKAARVAELLALFRLDGFGDRSPRTLSGGQQQRVALARALARDARILLLDEPFSALDESLRIDLRRELLRLKGRLGLTIVFVTHDLREAHLLADRLAVFDQGQLLQFGARDEIFKRPASRRVAELTGVANIVPAVVCGQAGDCVEVEASGMILRCTAPPQAKIRPGDHVDLAIRAERVILRRAVATEPEPSNFIEAGIVAEDAYGATHNLRFEALHDTSLAIEVEIAARPYEVLNVATEKRWTLELPPADIHIMPANTTGRT